MDPRRGKGTDWQGRGTFQPFIPGNLRQGAVPAPETLRTVFLHRFWQRQAPVRCGLHPGNRQESLDSQLAKGFVSVCFSALFLPNLEVIWSR